MVNKSCWSVYIFPWRQPKLTRRACHFDVVWQRLDVAAQYFEEILLDYMYKGKGKS